MISAKWIRTSLLVGLTLGVAGCPMTGEYTIGEKPAVETHLDQARIDSGDAALSELIAHGQLLFDARFNMLDGQGRPASTGTGDPRIPDQPAFIRTSSPEANSCAGCHNQPRSGGGGDFVANVFVLAQAADPVTFSVAPEFSNERNTLGMFGAGPIEMLAREMSDDLIAIREAATVEAANGGATVTRDLVAKGVNFGSITVWADGTVDPRGIEGVDWDLIIKPFHQKGAVVSLREFTNNAMNHHHGMQASERFGGGVDADGDGYSDEMTVGDMTAIAVFQAALGTPGRHMPPTMEAIAAVERGETVFGEIGCTACHIPSMTLETAMFTEPNPYNPPGNARPNDLPNSFSFDMTQEGLLPRLEAAGGGAIVRAFTDLKRHDLNDDEVNFFANEQLSQGSLVGFASESDFSVPAAPRPTEEFLTRKLWDVGNSMPYGHRGDLTTLTEVITHHGGEGRDSRESFLALPQEDKDAVIEFLKSMQVLP